MKRSNSLQIIIALPIAVCLFFAGKAGAQEIEGARSLGLAGAQRALGNANEAIYMNPAGLALGQFYSVEIAYLDDARGSDRRFNSSVVDSQAGAIAAGLAYSYIKRRPDELASGDERVSGHRAELALATRIFDNAALGVTGRYLNFSRKLGEEERPGGFTEFTLDAGVQWRLSDAFGIGFAGYNLLNSKLRELPIGWGAGLGWMSQGITAEFDIRYNAQIGKAMYTGGLGYVIADTVPLRAGLSYDLADKAIELSVGLGFIVDNFAIDLGYRQRVNGERVAEDDDRRILGAAIRATVF